VRNVVERAMTVVTTGRPATIPDPFTGKPCNLPTSPATKTVAAHLSTVGLKGNQEFMGAFKTMLEEAAATPLFSLFTAFDGEGGLVEDVSIEVRIYGGDPLPTCLHEYLFPINGDLLADRRHDSTT
jgi:hypothetical protein